MSRLSRILFQTAIIGKAELDKIPVIENGEPLLNLADFLPDLVPRMSKRRIEFAGTEIFLARETVAHMLSQAAKLLAPNYRLVLYDAHRPIEYQRGRYEQVHADIRSRNPQASEDKINELTFQVVFPPDEDPQKSPPHATGGAIDLTIIKTDGTEIDMGSRYGIYDDDVENQRHMTNSKNISSIQRQNRIVLIQAMVESGFCNYPGEWWHFMYGDREFAAYEGLSHAIYGRADLAL